MPNLELQLLSEKDIPEFTLFMSTLWQSLSHLYSHAARDAESSQYTIENISKLYQDPNYLLITGKVNDTIVAGRYAVFEANTLFLYLTGIANEYQRQGFGQQLHEFTFSYLRDNHPDVHKVWCDTIQSNVPGIQILKKVGFVLEADLKNHWYGDDYYLWGYQLK